MNKIKWLIFQYGKNALVYNTFIEYIITMMMIFSV